MSPSPDAQAGTPMTTAQDVNEGSHVLVATYRRQLAIAAAAQPEPWRWWAVCEHVEQVTHGPAYRPAEWFGFLLPEHVRRRCRRAIDRLEAEGLIISWRKYGDRLTHLKLTPTGERLAIELLAKYEHAGQDASPTPGPDGKAACEPSP